MEEKYKGLKTSPNQFMFVIHQVKIDKDSVYYQQEKEAMYKASRQLLPASFKLWCYFSSLKDTDSCATWAFSPTDVSKKMGIHRNTIAKAFEDLEEHGYIYSVQKTKVFAAEGIRKEEPREKKKSTLKPKEK